MIALIGMGALLGTSCGSSRKVSESSRVEEFKGLSVQELRDSVRTERIEVLDTLKEVTTITIRTNEVGDTMKVVQVTERDRIKNRDRVLDNHEKVVIRTDTVFIEKRDSVFVQTNTDGTNRTEKGSTIVTSLKWMFWIIVAVIALIIVIKVSKVFKFF